MISREATSFLAFVLLLGALVAAFAYFEPPRYVTQLDPAAAKEGEFPADGLRPESVSSSGMSVPPSHGAVLLLSDHDVTWRNLKAPELGAFMQEVERVVDEATRDATKAYRMKIGVTFSPDRPPRFGFIMREVPDAKTLESIETIKTALASIEPLHTSTDEVRVQMWHFVGRK